MTIVALVAVGLGGATNVLALFLAASGGTDVAPVVAGGGTAVMATALAYVVRQLLSGALVARSTLDTERKLTDLVKQGLAREVELAKLTRAANQRRRSG